MSWSPRIWAVGDHLYSTGGSEAQRAPNRSTHCKLPHQWQTEHRLEVLDSLASQGQAATDRASSKATNDLAGQKAAGAYARSTNAISDKIDHTDKLKGALADAAAKLGDEIAALEGCMAATQAAIDSKKAPLEAVADWYDQRATRYASERLCDPIKHDLEVMTATLKESLRLLDSALSAQQSERMRLMARKAALEADVVDKATALSIDSSAKAFPAARPYTAPVGAPAAASFGSLKSFGSAAGSSQRFPTAGGSITSMHVLHAPYDPVMWAGSSKALIDEARKAAQVSARLRTTSGMLIKNRLAAEYQLYQDLVRV